jgi:hypothetical protein
MSVTASDESRFAPQKKGRTPFEQLVREVSGVLNDPTRRTQTVRDVATELGEHPWRIVDALDAIEMASA